jgi:hypothetical protein
VKNQSGKVKVALLLWLIVIAAAVYYGVEFGGVYMRQYKLADAVEQQLGFAGQLSNQAINERIQDAIAEIGLPAQARRFRLVETQGPRVLQFSVTYSETLNLLFTSKPWQVTIERRRSY